KYYPYGKLPANLTDVEIYRDSPAADANYWTLSTNNSFQDWQSYAQGTDTDWQEVMFQTALIQEYRLNLSGGNESTKYSLMGGYLNQDGIVINSAYERLSGRINWEHKLNAKLKLTANISSYRAVYDGIATGSADGVITNMLKQKPTTPFDINRLEEEDESSLISNPYIQARDITKDRFRNNLVARLVLDYNINKFWQFKATGTYVNNNNKDKTFYPYNVSQGFKSHGTGIQVNSANDKLLGEAFLTYTKRFNKSHRLKVMGGAIVEKFVSESVSINNQNFPNINLGSDGLQLGIEPQIPTSSYIAYQMLSVLGRAEYNIKDRYLLTGTLREDGSSRFGTGNKWALFPSLAFAWRVSEEKFLKNQELISNLKLRLSAGSSGNTAIPAYRSLSSIGMAFHPMNGKDVLYGTYINRFTNKNLRWETTDQLDGGLDFGLFDNRFNVTIDAYLKRTRDLLLEKNTPLYSGQRKTWTNIGAIRNKGLEITFGAIPVRNKNWDWTMDFNIAFNRSKVLDIGPGGEMGFDPGVIPGSGNFVMIRQGESLGQWYGYKVEGVYHSQAEIDADPITEVLGRKKENLRPGDHKFVDVYPDNKIDSRDLTILGRGEPLFTGGFTNALSYKGLHLSFMLQYSYGAKVFNANRAALDSGRDGYNQTAHLADSWRPTLYNAAGDLVDAGNPKGKYRLPGGEAENYCLSEFIEDGSFLRISDITLAYTLPKKTIRKWKVQGIKLFASAKNVYTFTRYFGYDPEVNTRQGQTGDLMPSLDFGAYPRNKAISFGLDITF
ncbi:MAG: TonB-dependent receptor, partial [Candidatus Symbiothrix sp.]|nr:TonB-dependent receptor [Candidatus Symbiothrix sp.]